MQWGVPLYHFGFVSRQSVGPSVAPPARRRFPARFSFHKRLHTCNSRSLCPACMSTKLQLLLRPQSDRVHREVVMRTAHLPEIDMRGIPGKIGREHIG